MLSCDTHQFQTFLFCTSSVHENSSKTWVCREPADPWIASDTGLSSKDWIVFDIPHEHNVEPAGVVAHEGAGNAGGGLPVWAEVFLVVHIQLLISVLVNSRGESE